MKVIFLQMALVGSQVFQPDDESVIDLPEETAKRLLASKPPVVRLAGDPVSETVLPAVQLQQLAEASKTVPASQSIESLAMLGLQTVVAKALVNAGLTTPEAILAHPELTSIQGIGEATAAKVRETLLAKVAHEQEADKQAGDQE
ncbi:helix-hairpin-helix domain-containing protein [Rubinisphaera sp.]|uniref:helix-hairpin-helix domain-containing protein n=1 Tax=Rubinisphaera sp. TaxID=2024857 RepID=UPI0025F69745|nr:helix-hairpin-helix domain-containing protein [Rubinisphaera sp.]